MPQSALQKIGNKSGHMYRNVMQGMKRGMQLGIVGGAILGVGALFVTANIATMGSASLIMGVASYSVLGAAYGMTGGVGIGAILGSAKGLLTRPKPNGEQILENAVACSQEKEAQQGQEPVVQPEVPAVKMAQQQGLVATKSPAIDGRPTNPPALPKDASNQLKEMTQTLSQMQTDAQTNAPAAPNAAQTPAPTVDGSQTAAPQVNWQNRVQQPQQPPAEQRQR